MAPFLYPNIAAVLVQVKVGIHVFCIYAKLCFLATELGIR